MLQLTQEIRDEYINLFSAMTLRPERIPEVNLSFKRIIAAKSRYEAVGHPLGIPWFVVGILHILEAGGGFGRHLHNGDPLTARTIHKPPGRPQADPAAGAGQPYTWEESAVDALILKGMDQVGAGNWDLPTIAFRLEDYNGFGYRKRYPWIKSPYLWSFSNVYSHGKFTSDGTFSESAVSKQCGGLVLLHYMIDHLDAVKQAVTIPGFTPSMDTASETPYRPEDGSLRDWPQNPPVLSGEFLSRGSSGDLVRQVQGRLRDFGVTAADTGQFDPATEAAVKLFQSRSVDERGHPLEVDGIIGPRTWTALFGPKAAIIAPSVAAAATPAEASDRSRRLETLLDIAHDQVGVMENPPGSNKGEQVNAYLASVGKEPGNYWCMAFVYWVHQQACRTLGTRLLVPRTAGVINAWTRSQNLPEIFVVSAARARTNPASVTPGMVFFLDLGGGNGHCGIVSGNHGGQLTTIEGNTNDNGSSNGIGVFIRTRRSVSASSLLGFADYLNIHS